MREGWFTSHRETDDGTARARLEALFHLGWTPPESYGEGRPDARTRFTPSEPAGPEPQGRGPEGREPEGREPQGREPEGREPEGREPEGREPQGREPEPAPVHSAPRGLTGRRSSWRLDPGRRGAVAVLAAVLLAAVVVGWRVLADQPQSRAVPVTAQLALGPGSSGPSAAGSSGAVAKLVVVDVVGKVRRPGLVRLPVGARVDDAVRAAGGAIPGTDLGGLNLARVLTDGEQIAVGAPAASPAVGTSVVGGGAAALVNLNSATVGQLDGLPGVGPVLAQRIIDWRTTHGRFESVDQLTQVVGVGEAKFADMKPLVTV